MGSSDLRRSGRGDEYSAVIAELAKLNTALAKYVVQALNADNAQASGASTEEELELAEHLSAAAQALCDRVRHRELNKKDGACGAHPQPDKDKQ